MAESQVLSVITMWAAVAWADGVLAEAEAESLRRLIRSAELTADERASALKLLAGKVELPATYLASLGPEARRGVYRAACRMAVVDHVFHQSERMLLDRLRGLLEVPEAVAREIEADLPDLI
jgi:uncharacterized membrane protein YebE (DUF533 family)